LFGFIKHNVNYAYLGARKPIIEDKAILSYTNGLTECYSLGHILELGMDELTKFCIDFCTIGSK